MKFLFFIIVFLLQFSLKQDEVVVKLNASPEIFACDHLDNVYIYSNSTLQKFNNQGSVESKYSSMGYGNLSSIDVSDPFRIVLFYKEFNTIVILDNKLNQIGEAYQLDKLGFSAVDAVCKSKQSGIWILDSYAQKLMLYSLNPKGFIHEIDLARYTKPINYLEIIVENGEDILLFGKGKSVLIFNQLGGKLGIVNACPENAFQVKGRNLYYVNQNHLLRFDFSTEQLDTLNLEGFEKFDDVKIGNEKMFVLNKDTLTITTKPVDF
jgi:hypothetical protein